MPLTALFDLDETLLGTNMDRFLPAYFNSLGNTLSNLGSHDKIISQIQYAVRMMVANQDPAKTLKEVFDDHFYVQLGTTEAACQQTLKTFYAEEYPNLKAVTHSHPEASELVDWCLSMGMVIAVATNPLFPHTATRQRIEWANFNPDDLAFFTSYNDFHFTKPHLAYYAEVLGRLGWPETPVVMIGDNLSEDLFPMDSMGYDTFWVRQANQGVVWEGGTLSEVKPWLIKVMDKGRQSTTSHPEVDLAVLRATPAVIDTWLRQPVGHPSGTCLPNEIRLINLLNALISNEERVFSPFWEQITDNPAAASTTFDALTKDGIHHLDLQDVNRAFHRFLTARTATLATVQSYYLYERQKHTESIQNWIEKMVNWMTVQDQRLLNQTLNL